MPLTPDELRRIAHLARLAVSETEIATLQHEFSGIFSLIEQLRAVDTQGVEPLSHPLEALAPMALRLREDQVTQNDQREANMMNAPQQENGLFLVPRVIE